MNKTNTIINRILEVDNFQNMASCCDDFADFVTEILEWGVDHIAGVDFFDSYKSFRELWRDFLVSNPNFRGDSIAKRTSFNDYVDGLNKDGLVTDYQAYNWSNPF